MSDDDAGSPWRPSFDKTPDSDGGQPAERSPDRPWDATAPGVSDSSYAPPQWGSEPSAGAQPYTGQPTPEPQGYPTQQYPSHQPSPQQYPGQQYPPQQYPGQQYPGQYAEQPPYAGQPYGAQPYAGPPYASQSYPGQAYAAGQQGYPGYVGGQSGSAQTDGSAVAALVCAIASWVVCPVIPAIVALVLARSSDKAIAAANGYKSGTGLNKAARIISWLNIGFFIVLALAIVAILIVVAATGSDGGTSYDA